MKLIQKAKAAVPSRVKGEEGALASYGIAWLLGVPVTLLVIIYLIFGR